MSEVCSPDRFYSDNIMVNLFERVICTSAKLMTKEEIKNSPLDGESEMVEIPIRDFIHSGARYLSTLEKIRAISDKNERDDMKRALLPAASISATFTTRDGNIQLDLKGKLSGRGAYICRSVSCFEKACKSKALERSLGVSIPEDIYGSISAMLDSEKNG